jgi:hypothetical protein
VLGKLSPGISRCNNLVLAMASRVKAWAEVSLGIGVVVGDVVVVVVVGSVVAGVDDVIQMMRHRGVSWEGPKTMAM